MRSFDLPEPSPFRFREFDKKLYRAIQSEPEARAAFQNLTGGKRAIDPSWLLFSIGVACCSTDPPRQHAQEDAWMDKWRDKWDGLRAATRSLRLIAQKIEKHLEKSEVGPAPLAYMGLDRWEKEYQHGLRAETAIRAIPRILVPCAELVVHSCEMQKKWLAERPKVSEGLRFQTLGLLRWVKERKGRIHFERMAALINVARKLRGLRAVSGDSLRKLWKNHAERPSPRLMTSV